VSFILGARDQMTSPKVTGEIAKALRARVVSLPSGHHLMAEVPDGVLAALRAALA
jgi:pimeloyl-ACP methyl ester carboxylesterase